MSIFTRPTTSEFAQLVDIFNIAPLVSQQGIFDGVTNSVFLLVSAHEKHILIIYEHAKREEVELFCALSQAAARENIPCPVPLIDVDKKAIHNIQGKPSLIFPYIEGDKITAPNPKQCFALGECLARFHINLNQPQYSRANPRDINWYQASCSALENKLKHQDKLLAERELSYLQQQSFSIPRGIIHADLFRDNVLFKGDTLVAIFDFDFVCKDILLLDLAICVNDWCFSDANVFNADNYQALIDGYQLQRATTQAERENWSVVLRLAAMRFWLSRLLGYYQQQEDPEVQVKDPAVFKQRLQFHQQNNLAL